MKILITGISGFLGYNLYMSLKGTCDIIGTHSQNPLNLEKWNSSYLNLANENEIVKLFNYYSPDLVIHAAAMSKVNECEQNPELTYQVNTNATLTLANLCDSNNSKLIFISTDLVFDGKSDDFYFESDKTNPINVYAKSKAKAENLLLTRPDSNFTIMRMPLMFGNGGPFGKSSSFDLIEKLKKNEKYSLFTNEYRTPLTGGEAAKSIARLLNCPEKILHVSGNEKINRYDLGKIICKHYKFNENLLIPTIYQGSTRPQNVSLDCTLAKKFGHNPMGLNEQLNHF